MFYRSIGTESWSLAGKTYSEIVDVARRDGSILMIPVGSIEQHGHHMPVGTDTILVDAVANLGAELVTEDVPVLVTPPVWAGHSPHHMGFGGTITMDADELLIVLEGVADSALENGFDALVLLNGHGGNASLIASATSTIGRHHPEAEALGLTYFELAEEFIDDIRESDVGGMAHAGEFETSLMMHLRPELVREDRLAGTPQNEPYDDAGQDLLVGGPLSVYRPFEEYSDSGAIGDPELASPEKGETIFEKLGDRMEEVLSQIHEQNR